MFFISLSVGATGVVLLMLLSLMGYMLYRGSARLLFSPVIELVHADGTKTVTALNHNVEFDIMGKDGKYVGKSPGQASQQFVNFALENAKLSNVAVPEGIKAELWGEIEEEIVDPWAEPGSAAAAKVKTKKSIKIKDLPGVVSVGYDISTQTATVKLAEGTVQTYKKPQDVQFRQGATLLNIETLGAKQAQENPAAYEKAKAEARAKLYKNVPEGYEPVDPNWKAWELAHVTKMIQSKPVESEDRIAELKSAVAFRTVERWNWFQFFWAFPRSGNTEGGVLPCIYGTVMMTLIMTLIVAPFGIATAVYLREYAKDTWFTHMIRLAVANLAGVPSIVFGLFGLGFFILTVGRGVDDTFYNGNKVFGTPCVLWASLTMALLTLPVMIVAAEEALRTVPKELREGALALGATKFSSIVTVVIPSALPGILTGVILAVARGAGEVAPLLLTGVVAHKDQLPTNPLEKFMDLAYHIYDLAVKSQPNRIEEAQALAFSAALVLVMVVLGMNLLAIWLRAKLSLKK
jgi:phosphate ABC transporter permease subunit PstA